MSIRIYTGNNRPTNLEFVFDVDSYCNGLRIRDNELNRKILTEVEKGSYLSEDIFTDRFGRGLYVSCLSTSSKILITLNQNSNVLINCSEIGLNALDLILECSNCNVYFNYNCLEFKSELRQEVYVNDVLCKDVDELNLLLGRVDSDEVTGYRN